MVFMQKKKKINMQHVSMNSADKGSEKERGQRGQVGQFCYERGGEKKESKKKRENSEAQRQTERERDMPLSVVV